MSARSRRLLPEGPLFWSAALLLAFVTIMLRVAYVTLDDVANGRYDTLLQRAVEEGTGVLSAALLFLLVAAPVARRFPIAADWRRALAAHAGTFVVVTILHTLLMAGSREVLFPLLGLGDYHYGPLGVRLLMEAPNDLIFYALFVGSLEWWRGAQARRARERRALELERELAAAELANLRLQLQPHFLFNALNTIASATWEDPAAADAMIGHLSELLRHALGTDGRDELPLGEELALLEHYLALVRARFGDRLTVRVAADDAARTALVPPLLLQPLVENAIRHGVAPDGAGEVRVTGWREGGRLRLAVENGLPQAGVRAGGSGVGLTTTVRRLALLHGEAARVDAGPTDDGWWRVGLEIPVREAAAPGPASSGAGLPSMEAPCAS